MRKVNLKSGLNAKLALATVVVAGFTLTGCEKEDFTVNVPDITVTVPEPEVVAGKIAVVLTATSANGNDLSGVTFTKADGSPIEQSTEYEGATTFLVYASKEGYKTAYKTVVVPAPKKDSYTVLPINFTLAALEAPADGDLGEIDEDSKTNEDMLPQKFTGTFEPGVEYTRDVEVPTGTYMTAEQKEALLAKVDELAGPVTRALSEEGMANLLTAKGQLKEYINGYVSKPATIKQPVTFTVSEAASSVELIVSVDLANQSIVISTEVADERYEVEGEVTAVQQATVTAGDAEGIEVSHGHGHGHGSDANAGGGQGGK